MIYIIEDVENDGNIVTVFESRRKINLVGLKLMLEVEHQVELAKYQKLCPVEQKHDPRETDPTKWYWNDGRYTQWLKEAPKMKTVLEWFRENGDFEEVDYLVTS